MDGHILQRPKFPQLPRPHTEPGQSAIVVALAAVGTLVGKQDAMDRETVDMAILGRGQARVQGKRFPTS